MKTKQLANILIKILGVSFFLHAIPSMVSGFLMGLFSLGPSKMPSYSWTYAVGGGIQIAIAVLFIIKSRQIAEFLFKGQDE